MADWQQIVTALAARYPYKAIARAVDSSPQTLEHLSSGRRAGARVPYETGARLLALYALLVDQDSANATLGRYDEWAVREAMKMRERTRKREEG